MLPTNEGPGSEFSSPLGEEAGRATSAQESGDGTGSRAVPWRPVSSVDVVPDRRLGYVPVPSSRDDIDVLFQEYAYLNSLEETAVAAFDARTKLLAAEHKKKLVTEIEGRDVTFADRRTVLELAILGYVELHEDEFFADGSKTDEFNFGVIKKRQKAAGIELKEGLTAKDVKERLEKRTRLWRSILKLLGGAKLFGLALGTFWRVKPEVNLEEIEAAYLAKKLNKRQLGAIGYEPCGGPGCDKLSISVKKWTVRSEPKNAPDVAA